MVGILAELGRAEAYPDADPALVQGVRDQILSAVKPAMDPMAAAGGDPMAGDPMAALMGGGGAPPPGGPVPVEQAMGRLPRTPLGGGENSREMAASIERELSGI